MEHTTHDIDADALLAEMDALLAETDDMDARFEALLCTGSAAVVMADLALQTELGRQQLDEIEAALNALEAP